jgi:hypothetical protein
MRHAIDGVEMADRALKPVDEWEYRCRSIPPTTRGIKMRTSSLLFGASICVFIAGCGLIPRATPDCSPTECPVTVTVSGPDPTQCIVAVDKEEIRVPNDNVPRQIVWSLVAPDGFTFPEDPINQKNDWRGDFQGPKPAAKRFELQDLNNPRTGQKRFDYGVKVAYKGKQCGEHDPVIINDM